MKRFHAHIGSADCAVSKAPEILHAVCVDFSANIFNRMIDNLVGIIRFKAIVRKKTIRVQMRTCFHMRLDFGLQGFLPAIRYYHGMNLAMLLTVFRLAIVATLQHSEDCRA